LHFVCRSLSSHCFSFFLSSQAKSPASSPRTSWTCSSTMCGRQCGRSAQVGGWVLVGAGGAGVRGNGTKTKEQVCPGYMETNED
jgi:hypothetical protein